MRSRLACLILPATLVAASPVLADGDTVVLSRAECELLTRHVPDADVAYRPGIDAAGQPVVPADLAPPGKALPDRIVIDLKRPLGQVPQITAPAALAQSDVNLGQIAVDVASGQVLLNGRPVESDVESSMIAACRKAGAR